jgi:hypothetical protein
MKYVHLDDSAIKLGGTNFTSLAILESRVNDVVSIPCSELKASHIEMYKDRLWIVGNIMGLGAVDKTVVLRVFEELDFVKIEFDYNYCQYRGDAPHEILGKAECECPHGKTGHPLLQQIYDLIAKRAKLIFYMSFRQMCKHVAHIPTLPPEKMHILSSCFTQENFKLFERVRQERQERLHPHNGVYAIMQGFGGWHSEAKGLTEAKNHCLASRLPYQVLPVQEYEDHITGLSNFKGLVFLPIVDDTCPRSIIEAKLLGLEVITNLNSQHVTENWWRGSIQDTEDYLKARPNFFWSKIDEVCNTSTSV